MAEFTPFAIIPDTKKFAERAANAASAKYGKKEEWMGKGDAFRHMAWQAMMAQKYGPTVANLVGQYHELPLGRRLGAASQEQTDEEKQMDLFNNTIGRQIGVKAKNMDEMYKMLEDAITSGKAKYLDQHELEYRAKVREALRQEEPTAY